MFASVIFTVAINVTSLYIHQQMIGLFKVWYIYAMGFYGKESVNIIPCKCINPDLDITKNVGMALSTATVI